MKFNPLNILKRLGRYAWEHKLLTIIVATVIGFAITPIVIITRTYFIVHTDRRPTPTHIQPVLEEQTEAFTCGVHSLSTLYKAYGLDPAAERIRWRLGVDTKAVFWMSDSTGALHPDMYMVLIQDFFEIDALDVLATDAWDTLLNHLDNGHMAVLLIRRRENGHLHWVVASKKAGDKAEIYDSLFPDPYLEGRDFLENHIVTAMMVRPTADGRYAMSSFAAHRAGSNELVVATKRIKALKEAETGVEGPVEAGIQHAGE